ncbi:MAG: (Fe-S)-binding protein, partial [Verrucomicrobiae bacterium]|nr:(Fe-S)-binding protein [Verrucomicrobiae bacterium]
DSPEMSAKLLARKVDNIKKTGAPIVASANPGCCVQLESSAGVFRTVHPVTLLAEAYRAERESGVNQRDVQP